MKFMRTWNLCGGRVCVVLCSDDGQVLFILLVVGVMYRNK